MSVCVAEHEITRQWIMYFGGRFLTFLVQELSHNIPVDMISLEKLKSLWILLVLLGPKWHSRVISVSPGINPSPLSCFSVCFFFFFFFLHWLNWEHSDWHPQSNTVQIYHVFLQSLVCNRNAPCSIAGRFGNGSTHPDSWEALLSLPPLIKTMQPFLSLPRASVATSVAIQFS